MRSPTPLVGSVLFALVSLSACEEDELSVVDASFQPDALAVDSGPRLDARPEDARPEDARPEDARPEDAVGLDIEVPDAGDVVRPDAEVRPDGDVEPALCAAPEPPLTAGSTDCAGCPTSDPTPSSFQLVLGQVTTVTLSGNLLGATGDGIYTVIGAGGRRIDGPVPVNAGGWSVTVPLFCGAQQVALTFCNEAGVHRLVFDVSTECSEPDLRLTISWDELGDDWELHLIQEGGRINDPATDCTWTTCLGGGLDWGVLGDATDDPVKDVDDVDGYGPENITLTRPAPGTYTVMVEHWGTSGSPGSDGEAILNVVGQAPIVVPITDLPPHWVRTVATVSFPGGAVVTSAAVHDCTQNWSGGCLDPIP
ncbi:MAG: hypothetical protein HY791_30255 [Deltaproteobacteria bacterium]|nr:hypothetical protein [Deltaproteobacteria bacterium]